MSKNIMCGKIFKNIFIEFTKINNKEVIQVYLILETLIIKYTLELSQFTLSPFKTIKTDYSISYKDNKIDMLNTRIIKVNEDLIENNNLIQFLSIRNKNKYFNIFITKHAYNGRIDKEIIQGDEFIRKLELISGVDNTQFDTCI